MSKEFLLEFGAQNRVSFAKDLSKQKDFFQNNKLAFIFKSKSMIFQLSFGIVKDILQHLSDFIKNGILFRMFH